MNIQFGDGKTKFGPGVQINLDGNVVAVAIYTYLMAHDIIIDGAATIRVNGELCEVGEIYVDPSGNVISKGVGYSGRGHKY